MPEDIIKESILMAIERNEGSEIETAPYDKHIKYRGISIKNNRNNRRC